MKNLCLGQIPRKIQTGQDKGCPTHGCPLLLFLPWTTSKGCTIYTIKVIKISKKNLDKISAIRKEFWFPKILSHRI